MPESVLHAAHPGGAICGTKGAGHIAQQGGDVDDGCFRLLQEVRCEQAGQMYCQKRQTSRMIHLLALFVFSTCYTVSRQCKRALSRDAYHVYMFQIHRMIEDSVTSFRWPMMHCCKLPCAAAACPCDIGSIIIVTSSCCWAACTKRTRSRAVDVNLQLPRSPVWVFCQGNAPLYAGVVHLQQAHALGTCPRQG